ncbi:3-oxoacyl-ACP reductase [Leuconostocaceae bacterium ESL0958]|nr:3-oxoacyl-ACP reductase [Leuconostocaceae bacterium ESL0958]
MIEQDYREQRVCITGAASGIGLAQTKAYLAAGANVLAIDRQPMPITERNLVSQVVDLADEDALMALARSLEQAAPFDIFLSTAGMLDGFQPLLKQSMGTIDQVLATNLRPAVVLTQALLPAMIKRGQGALVYMASIAGLVAGGGGAAYTMSKHALVGLTKQLAFDYAQDGIRVNAIAPGAVQTPMNAADFAGDGAMAAQVAAQTPAKRWAQPEEVADLTLFVTSPQANYLAGTVIPLDGGWTLGH